MRKQRFEVSQDSFKSPDSSPSPFVIWDKQRLYHDISTSTKTDQAAMGFLKDHDRGALSTPGNIFKCCCWSSH